MGRNAAREKVGTPVTKEADLYSWAVRQAQLLRTGRLSEIDPAAIAGEIDDVGEEQYLLARERIARPDAASSQMGPSARPPQPVMDTDGPGAKTPRAAPAQRNPGLKSTAR